MGTITTTDGTEIFSNYCNCSGKPAILCVLIAAQMCGQCVRYLLCGLVPAAQGRPPLSCGGP